MGGLGRWCPKCAKEATALKTKQYHHVKNIEKQIDYLLSDKRKEDIIDKMIKPCAIEISKLYTKHKEMIKRKLECNRKRDRDRYKHKYHNNIEFRINERLKGQLRKCLIKDRAMGKYYDLLGYTSQELKQHIESLFTDGMSWDRIGEIHIDHVRPKSWFDLINPDGTPNEEEVKKCWALHNLQPLWAVDNIKKNNKYEG